MPCRYDFTAGQQGRFEDGSAPAIYSPEAADSLKGFVAKRQDHIGRVRLKFRRQAGQVLTDLACCRQSAIGIEGENRISY
jgi:hypothetical protein